MVTTVFYELSFQQTSICCRENRMEAIVEVAVEIFGLFHPLLLRYKSLCTVINQKL